MCKIKKGDKKMAKLTMAQVKENAKNEVKERLNGFLTENEAVQFDDNSFAVLTEIEGQEVWVEISLTAKQYTKTKVADPFDPYEKAQEWQDEVALKAKEKETKAKAKADKIAASKAKREKKGE